MRQRPVKERLQAVHAEHPEFCDVELAQAADCHSAYVRNRAGEWGWVLPSRSSRNVEMGGSREWKPAAARAAVTDMEWRMKRLRNSILGILSEAG